VISLHCEVISHEPRCEQRTNECCALGNDLARLANGSWHTGQFGCLVAGSEQLLQCDSFDRSSTRISCRSDSTSVRVRHSGSRRITYTVLRAARPVCRLIDKSGSTRKRLLAHRAVRMLGGRVRAVATMRFVRSIEHTNQLSVRFDLGASSARWTTVDHVHSLESSQASV